MSNFSDVIGGKNFYGGSNSYFVSDRYENSNSAIYFNNGYLNIPPGVYFSVDFTISVYIYLISFQNWSPIINFGNDVND